jgi:ectoine hydroxylase-related dioxygenase (phytanoyl-CoA dioxygenase family)
MTPHDIAPASIVPELPLGATAPLACALDEAGCAIVRGALPLALCDRARSVIDALEPVHWDETHTDPRGGGRFLDRYLCVFNRNPFWLPFLDRPGIVDLAEAVLGVDCHVIGMTAWRCHPGYRGDALHVDYAPVTWPADAMPDTVRVPVFVLTAHFYLNAVTADRAPTRIVPGSHRAGRAPRADEDGWGGITPVTVLANAGDVLVFRSDVWHAGSDNASADRVRYLLQVHYGRRAMAQHFSPFMDWRFAPAVLAAATPRQRRLLGDHEPGPYD